MASGLLFQVVFIVTLMMFSKMIVSETCPSVKTECFFERFLKYLNDIIPVPYIQDFLRGLLCPGSESTADDEQNQPPTTQCYEPKMYVSYRYDENDKRSIASFDLVDGKYQEHAGDEITIKGQLNYFTTNKAGDKIYAIVDSNITIYSRTPCSHQFKRTYTEDVGYRTHHLILDPSENYLLTIATNNEYVSSFRLDANGSMYKVDEYKPKISRSNHVVQLAYNSKLDIVAVANYGISQIELYHFDRDTGKLTNTNIMMGLSNNAHTLELLFSEDGMFLYVLGLNPHGITVFKAKFSNQVLIGFTNEQEIPYEELKEHIKTGALGILKIHPNGKYLYSYYLQYEVIILYDITTTSDPLTTMRLEMLEGNDIMNIDITPKGEQLLVPYFDLKKIVIYTIDGNGGLTKDYEIVTADKRPVYINIVPSS